MDGGSGGRRGGDEDGDEGSDGDGDHSVGGWALSFFVLTSVLRMPRMLRLMMYK